MEKIIVNQKTYLNSLEEVENFIENTYNYRDKMIVLPSYPYIPFFKAKNYIVGSQDISEEKPGAHTGEVTAESLKNIGVEYTLIGHSETREKIKDVVKKIKRAKKNNLKIILCVGEKDGEALESIDRQLEDIIPDEDITISYEPVWAIGSNKTPSESDITAIAHHIKSKGFKRVLYGGSVNEDSIKRLNKIPNIDGFLLGSPTLKPNSIVKMIEVVSK